VPVSIPHDLFRLNVGFIIHENVGYVRDLPFEVPSASIPPDLELKNLTGNVRVTRATQGLLVQTEMRTEIIVECVRCLTDFSQPLEIDFTELYAFNRNSVTESGLLVPENGKIDLEPFIRDEMLLAIPISPLCSPDCKGLCPICGQNLNEGSCYHEEKTLDTRLSVLRTLLDGEHNSA
jgi:DUF177 domain-containing protein